MGGNDFGRLFTAIRAAVTVVLGQELPSPKVVSERAKTDTFGCRKYKEIYASYEKLFNVLRRVGNSGTSLLISTAHKFRCSTSLLSNCYQPEQLKTSHICEISHYILRPVTIYSSLWYHSNIVKCRSNGNISSVETLCPNIYHSSIAPNWTGYGTKYAQKRTKVLHKALQTRNRTTKRTILKKDWQTNYLLLTNYRWQH